ncbi:hypothetical protein Rrhod_3414 [Rhodococcus rhodnii LMG 5362]|uniref:Uncharacterized protein n=1 Tax=Rhodococcus rhodnii LMG 5362 TaxID=1273125 RepID=R7WMR6_9NOCA|nr:hypothetical protein Rrhod_3414 [Rhodococcus rhodnii LMG 5362]
MKVTASTRSSATTAAPASPPPCDRVLGQPSGEKRLDEPLPEQRRHLGRLEQHGVSGSQCGADLA